MDMLQIPYGLYFKVSIDCKRSDQVAFFLSLLKMCFSSSCSRCDHPKKLSPSLSLSLKNCSVHQRIGPTSVSNIMTGPIAMEITSACWRHGLF